MRWTGRWRGPARPRAARGTETPESRSVGAVLELDEHAGVFAGFLQLEEGLAGFELHAGDRGTAARSAVHPDDGPRRSADLHVEGAARAHIVQLHLVRRRRVAHLDGAPVARDGQ